MNLKPVAAFSILALVASAGLLVAGPVNPPAGPVASTYKTLTEVEPRTAISPANTPGDATCVFDITQPGSYYLTGNVQVLGAKGGIRISAPGAVTIDLNGFEIVGVATSSHGIYIGLGDGPVTVRNGTVRGFGGNGVWAGLGGSIVESVHAINNSGVGIIVGNNALVRGCVSTGNAGNGINALDTSVITNCATRSNGGTGINTTQGAAISGCTTNNNGGKGILAGVASVISRCTSRFNDSNGIDADNETLVESCTIAQNTGYGVKSSFHGTIRQCVVYENGLEGIVGSAYVTITGNTASENGSDGILVNNDCVVTQNTCRHNGTGTPGGAGIHVLSLSNRVETNSCNDSVRGIDVDSFGNFISRNVCSGNSTNWTVVAGNVCLVVNGVTGGAFSGNSGGAAPGSADPNANFSY